MIFTRTYRYQSAMPAADIKSRLLGKHVKVHNMDFEVSEKDMMLRIIPHAEQVTAIKTLPITHIQFKDKGASTQVVISSKMRKIDKGGPTLVVVFCAVMMAGGIMFFFMGKEEGMAYAVSLSAMSLLIFIIFWMRMESGYFDYVRKLRDYIKNQSLS